jgi:hypothetical protein
VLRRVHAQDLGIGGLGRLNLDEGKSCSLSPWERVRVRAA